LESFAFDAAIRALDKQERVLDELRARTGLLLMMGARYSAGWCTTCNASGRATTPRCIDCSDDLV